MQVQPDMQVLHEHTGIGHKHTHSSIADAMPIVAGTRDIYEQKEHHPRNCLLVRVSEIADALGCRVAHAHELRADDA